MQASAGLTRFASSLDEAKARVWIRWLIVGGLIVRLGIDLSEPEGDDVRHFEETAAVIARHGFHAYSLLNAFDPSRPFDYRAYSYPPGFIPWLLAAHLFNGHAFAVVARLGPILADAVLAWLVQDILRRDGAAPWTRVAAVALVMAGPVFLSVSAVSGQIDGLAFVFVLLAIRVWQQDGRQRALGSGLLLGLGALVKLVPLLFVAALLPTGRSLRERTVALAATAAPVVLGLAPFLIVDGHGTIHTLDYGGFPGGGGLAVLFEPNLARHFLTDYTFPLTGSGRLLEHHGIAITVVAFVVVAALLSHVRVQPPQAAFILALTLLVFATNFYEQYLLWLLPLALVCRRLLLVLVIQLVMLPYLAIEGNLPIHRLGLDPRGLPGYVGVFTASIYVLWAVLATALGYELFSLSRGRGLELSPATGG